jgi:hypothetical protein
MLGLPALMATLFAGAATALCERAHDALRYREKMRTAEAMRYQQSIAMLREQSANALPTTL